MQRSSLIGPNKTTARGVKDKVLLVSKNGAGKWINADGKYGDTKSKKVITLVRFEKWINYLLDNLYVQVGDQLLR